MKIGLVLEGGANRGVFTSGVLDYFMEQDLKGVSVCHRHLRRRRQCHEFYFGTAWTLP